MVCDGWVKTFRKIKDWEWYTDSNMVHLLLHLVLSANHEPKRWKGVDVKRGQLVVGLHSLSKQTGISVQRLRTCLTRLEKTGEINKESNKQFTLITICNYEHYQERKDTTNKASNNQATNDQQTINNKQELKECKEVKPYVREVIEYLNTKTGKSYSSKSVANIRVISARLNDGYTVEDCKRVIDNQVRDWGNDEKMVKFLRPSTLFQTSKFDEYLNNVLLRAVNDHRQLL